MRENLGLNQPLFLQYLYWLGDVLRGDLGVSLFSGRPVTTLFAQRMEPTIVLSLCVLVLSCIVAIPAGIAAAWYRSSFIDRFILIFATLGFSTPTFVTGYVLIWVLALTFQWLPTSGFVSFADDPVQSLRTLIMPIITVSLVFISIIARITRASMIDVLAADYVRTARAKGASSFSVLYRHALRNGSLPIVTTIGGAFAIMIGGVVVTESVYAIPGLGRLLIDAIVRRDYPVIQGVILIVSGVYVLVNLLIDLSYVWLDPRIRTSER